MLSGWHLPVSPYIHLRDDALHISLWLRGADLPEQVFLRCEPDNEEWLLRMKGRQHDGFWRYRAVLPLREGQPSRRYCFKLLWADRQQWFSPQGFSVIPPAQLGQFAIDIPDNGPDWVADQLFYQIFPDRFASSQGDHGVQDGSYFHHAAGCPVVRREWNEPLDDVNASSTFYGGDLAGICEKLPYLQQLGVTALYLNPIFTAPSVHKYDTQDYYQVDPYLGGNEAFLQLREKTRDAGIKLLLDGVFNHTGDSHCWFDRHQQGTGGACHDETSPYRSWFNFSPDGQVLDWKGNSSLPKLNFASEGVVNQIYRDDDSVVRHWLRPPYSIDGWRLDVVHMLGEQGGAKGNLQHLAGIYQAAKQENSQAYILGEHFGDARNWLHAGVEDSAMNYMGFALPVRAFLAGVDVAAHPIKLDAAECAQWMDEYRAGLSHNCQLRLFNQLDSHDTTRFITLLNGNKSRMKMALGWLYSWIGVPCLYYGDEIGLDGENDPFCRKTFPWDESRWDHALLGLCRRMITLRHSSMALRRGGCQVLYAAGDSLVFIRAHQHERVLVALQRGLPTRLNLPVSPLLNVETWQREEGESELMQLNSGVSLQLGAESFTVWKGVGKY
ncbi:maltodextrin glucosidase [Yersinia ruckeri]|uniref:maltodextrin glucosidase n=1 Tax=Yersinia ruckeri TaxID=29486 RepID=UPI001F1AAE75|nr:maltodextrin glucosidase [Yersinia ruckeri]EKN4183293.1 maltodextrin glucosidase [Yersinia ruckeri]MCK8554861.1 maltodextrin glucosidase [Yersinia ruckeri]MCW6547091.1 maltodextrin glucosidase [Yersinia ruckeri]MCW6572189.1 maltodextrin glucosidase [Yersinia ruckeri]UIN01548.1 maltodextrin glucosidase [Yersinia ruckeri]